MCSTGGTHKREEEDRKDGRETVVIRLAGQGDLLSGFSRGWLSGLAIAFPIQSLDRSISTYNSGGTSPRVCSTGGTHKREEEDGTDGGC